VGIFRAARNAYKIRIPGNPGGMAGCSPLADCPGQKKNRRMLDPAAVLN